MAKSPFKGKGKIGPTSVDPASRGSNPSNTSGGFPGRTGPQKPIPGPASPGQPVAMKKALAKKPNRGGNATGAAGLIR